MNDGSFCYLRLKVVGELDDPREPFYDGPRKICAPMDKRGNIIEPVTLYYIKADQLVSTAQVKVEREEWGEI
jgi:hypothetical protein